MFSCQLGALLILGIRLQAALDGPGSSMAPAPAEHDSSMDGAQRDSED